MNDQPQKQSKPPKAPPPPQTREAISKGVKNWWNQTLAGAVEREIRKRGLRK